MSSLDPVNFGNWYFQCKLGSGGFGDVVLWRNNENNETIAIKKFRNLADIPYENLEKLKERWCQEVMWMKKLNSQFIVKAVNVEPKFMDWLNLNESNQLGLPILIMEYCDGGDLRSELKKIENSTGFQEFEIRKILKSLRCAISFLHNNCKITHRDIKPENIVIKNVGDGEKLYKLTDLGYAKDIGINTIEASMVGTKNYFAPEIITSFKYTNAVDYWSFGVIAFELITNVGPFIPHQSIFNYMEQLKNKPSRVIAISENNDGTLTEHFNIYRENQISYGFKTLMESWLTMALDYNPKSRVAIMDSQQNQVTNFERLDNAINSIILTVFSLSSYEFYSYPINENTTMKQLITLITTTTGIIVDDLYIFTPNTHNIVLLEKTTRPIDLYMDNWKQNIPMIYVTRVSKNGCLQLKPIDISPTIKFVIGEKKLKIKTFVYQEFVRHALFFLRNEERHYTTYLNGLKNYALTLETEIDYFKKDIDLMMYANYTTTGYMHFFIRNIHIGIKSIATKDKQLSTSLQNKYSQNCKNVIDTQENLTRDAKEIETRRNSILNRIRETIKTDIFNDNNKDYFNVKLMEGLYQSMTISKMAEYIKSISELVSRGIAKRRELLNSLNLIDTHAEVLDVHFEFQDIKENVNSYNRKLNALRSDIDVCNEQYQLEVFQFCSCNRMLVDPNDIDMMGEQMESLYFDNYNSSSQFNHEQEMSAIPDFKSITVGDDTNRIINENHNLMKALEDRANDVDMIFESWKELD